MLKIIGVDCQCWFSKFQRYFRPPPYIFRNADYCFGASCAFFLFLCVLWCTCYCYRSSSIIFQTRVCKVNQKVDRDMWTSDTHKPEFLYNVRNLTKTGWKLTTGTHCFECLMRTAICLCVFLRPGYFFQCLFRDFQCVPLPKYKVSGIYKPQICRKLAARLRLIFAARLPQTRFSYANYFSGALFWHTMCAASMQCTVAAHCTGTQCAPQVCSAQLSRTILAHNVRRTGKFAAHSCRALFWHTMCAVQVSLQHTVVAHYSGTQCAPYR